MQYKGRNEIHTNMKHCARRQTQKTTLHNCAYQTGKSAIAGFVSPAPKYLEVGEEANCKALPLSRI